MRARWEGRERGEGEVREWRKNRGRWTESYGSVEWFFVGEGERTFGGDGFSAMFDLRLEFRGSEVDAGELASYMIDTGQRAVSDSNSGSSNSFDPLKIAHLFEILDGDLLCL